MKPIEILRHKVRTLASDIRHGGFTGGNRPSRHESLGANETVSTHLSLIPLLLGPVLTAGDVFVDIGCGRGRVINWVIDDSRASHIFGIEIDKAVAAALCKRYRHLHNVSIVAGTALNALPDSATVMYLWNPFHRDVMAQFRDTVIRKYTKLGTIGRLRIVYHNCVDIDLWEAVTACRVTELDLRANTTHRAALIEFA